MSAQVIWKAILKPIAVQDIEAPEGAEILCAHEQYEQICVWFRCDPNAETVCRKIAIVATGAPAPAATDGRYLGTAFLRESQLVFHVFERTSP